MHKYDNRKDILWYMSHRQVYIRFLFFNSQFIRHWKAEIYGNPYPSFLYIHLDFFKKKGGNRVGFFYTRRNDYAVDQKMHLY